MAGRSTYRPLRQLSVEGNAVDVDRTVLVDIVTAHWGRLAARHKGSPLASRYIKDEGSDSPVGAAETDNVDRVAVQANRYVHVIDRNVEEAEGLGRRGCACGLDLVAALDGASVARALLACTRTTLVTRRAKKANGDARARRAGDARATAARVRVKMARANIFGDVWWRRKFCLENEERTSAKDEMRRGWEKGRGKAGGLYTCRGAGHRRALEEARRREEVEDVNVKSRAHVAPRGHVLTP